ncbi:uncharacterized protein LOC128395285 [Panonychus citri]|uniref:uncharacterized protein LOC128395285 n=1 Tax=Panonychus citri TaxID=50023 RepID=UPI002307B472|nr:uncharacterized protein LOC128395285 [Panonychus citri]XP_053211666.1 uncharacterized protein LOC128395285 [Panonychus citri]
MLRVEVKQEPDEVIRQRESAEAEAACSQISQLNEQQIDVKPFQQQHESGNINPMVFTNGHSSTNQSQNGSDAINTDPLPERNGLTHGEDNGNNYDGIGEENLTDERDIQVYEELMTRITAEVVLREPIASRVTVDERIKKINCYLEDETNCQMIILNDEPINNAWSSFRYPRNFDDFLETVFTWADNYLNDQDWPQDEILVRLKAFPYSLRYNSFKTYSNATISYLLVLYYDRLKKDADNLLKSPNKQAARDKGVSAKVDKITTDDQWSEIIFKLSNDSENLKFGFCCMLTVIDSYLFPDRKYFGSILGKQTVKQNGANVTYLTIKVLEFVPFVGDELAITNLFRIHHIYTAAECLFKLESSEYVQHYTSPNLASGPSGANLRFDEKNLDLTPFDCDAIHKGVDTFSISSSETSPVCCLDFRETSKSLKDLTDIAVQILDMMKSVPIDSRWIGMDIPALVICNNEEIISTLHEKFKKANFPIYRLNRKGEPTNLRDKIPKIGKALAKALSNIKLVEDAREYGELFNKWEFADEGIFSSEDQETKFNEILELAKVFVIQNSAVILGNIYDICNDTILNSAYCKFPVCIILGASSIPEVFTLPLMKYGCEKFVLIDRECSPWPGNKSMFTRLTSIYEVDHSVIKGAKCAVVTSVKKKLKLPDPPKVSRHKLIEENAKDSSTIPSSSHPGPFNGYNPEQRKNPRNRLPYCPRPATTEADNQSKTNTNQSNPS